MRLLIQFKTKFRIIKKKNLIVIKSYFANKKSLKIIKEQILAKFLKNKLIKVLLKLNYQMNK